MCLLHALKYRVCFQSLTYPRCTTASQVLLLSVVSVITHFVLAAVRREASPGKLSAFEDELFRNADMADVPVVAAIALAYVEGARTVGASGQLPLAPHQQAALRSCVSARGCQLVDVFKKGVRNLYAQLAKHGGITCTQSTPCRGCRHVKRHAVYWRVTLWTN